MTTARPNPADFHRARKLVLRHGWNATAYQVLNPGIHHWFSDDLNAMVGFVEARKFPLSRRRIWVAAGEPICSIEVMPGVVAAFEDFARMHKAQVCWFGADAHLRGVIENRDGYSEMVLGAQPVWNPSKWTTIVASKSSLRAQIHRALNKNVWIEEWDSETATDHPELRECLNEWLRDRGLPSLHFLVEPQTLHQLEDRRVFVARKDERPVAFLVLSPVPVRNGWLVEQLIRTQRSPNGTASLLLDAAMRASAESGSEYITLGLSPLSLRAPASRPNPAWLRTFLRLVRAYGRRFYNFEGLEAFKAKFSPDRWDPIVAITNEEKPSLLTLHAIADAFAGQRSPERLIADALLKATRVEFRQVSRRIRPNSDASSGT